MGEEQCGKSRFVVEHLNRLSFLQSHDPAIRQGRGSNHMPRLAREAALAKEVVGPEHGDNHFFALWGHACELDRAVLYKIDVVGRIALREHLLVLPVVGNRVSCADLGEKDLWIERQC